MSPAEQSKANIKRRMWLPTIVTVFIFGAIGVFLWRVVYYKNLIRSGDMLALEASYATQMSVSRLASASASFASKMDVVTADDPFLGSEQAELTIVEFADFGCPYSRQVSFLLRSLAYEYGDRLRYVYRDFPLDELHPEARLAAEAGACAHDQEKFWELHDKMYQNASNLSEEAIMGYAQGIGLDMGRFLSCVRSGARSDEVAEDYQAGLDAGVVGTPTFFFNGVKVEGAIPADVLRALVDRLANTAYGS
jgi:protein-disulfide isomerase